MSPSTIRYRSVRALILNTTQGVVCVLAVLVSIGCASAQKPRYYTRVEYEGTSGTVGHHMVADPYVHWDRNTWRGDPCPDSQGSYTLTGGSLPPGVTWNANSGTFQGTPQEPGEWHAEIHYRLYYCQHEGTREEFNTTAEFHISGDAVQSLP